ncbi:MAG: hypothetical protein SFU91_00745 [Chloroherpetonaceae bacterium]|nr:hypothetical protein [Chloroherpetonaceae bacterium]
MISLLPLSLTGCSSIIENLDSSKPHDTQRFKVDTATLHRAAVHYLLNEGYSILASDLSGGILSAEKSSPELLAEEQAESGRFAPSVAEAILGILGIILAIGFLFLVIKAVLEQQNQVGERSNYMMDNRVTGGTMAQEETLFYYRYIISFSYEPIETGLTELKLSIVRERYEKGIVVKSDKLQGKKLYSAFFQGISKELPHLR